MPEAIQTTAETPAAPPELTLEQVAAEVFGTDAPAETVADTPAESAKVEPAKTEESAKDERISPRITAAMRAEVRAAEQRAELRAQQQQIEAKQRDLDAREKRIKLIEDDPIRFFEEWKADPKVFLEKLAGEYKPENVVAKKVDSLEKQLAEERAAREKLQAETEHKTKAAQADAAWKEASGAFVNFVAASAEKYPHLVEEFTEQQATDEAFAALSEVIGKDANGEPVTRAEAYRIQYGDYPGNDTVAEYLDSIAKQRIEGRQKAGWRKPPATPSEGATPGDPKPASPVNGASPRTLTSRDSSTRASAPKQWSQEAADEESLRILEAALRSKS